MPDMPRIYLDNAATSWPKPEAVYAAVNRYQRELGAPLGRGVYPEAIEVERIVARLRVNLARLIGASEAKRIVFTQNCTGALNQAIHGLLREGDHVVTTVVEHNSTLRPLRQLEERGQIEVTRVRCDSRGVVDPDEIRKACAARTRLVAVTHASNVTGAMQPVADIGDVAKSSGATFLIDAAQTLGHVPIDVAAMRADLLAAPGHKGLLGPLGTGFLYLGPGMELALEPLMQGGTGSQSEQDRQPETLPDRFESGNLNALGLVGLAAGVDYVIERGVEAIQRHELELAERLLRGLREIEGIKVYCPDAPARVGVTSLTMENYEPQELAAVLDAIRCIQGRSGLHCAPLMHAALGTLGTGGTYRLSVGPFNETGEIDEVVACLARLAADEALV